MLISIVITAFNETLSAVVLPLSETKQRNYVVDAALELTYFQMCLFLHFLKSVDIDEIHHQFDIENGFEIVMTLLVRNMDYSG